MEFLMVLIIAVILMRPTDWQRFAIFLGKSLRLLRHYQGQLKTTLAKIESPVDAKAVQEQFNNSVRSSSIKQDQ